MVHTRSPPDNSRPGQLVIRISSFVIHSDFRFRHSDFQGARLSARNRPIRWLLLLALAIRLAWAMSRPAELSADLPDQAEYRSIAARLIVGDGLQFFDER